ncbi:tail assembly protein (endogenous virus) [Pseudomonas phage phiAH14a]|uniref:Tail assembly protein n=1 Tax=Pseudomonas phage phiAH14a TaxID=1805958 RepID=A0A1B0VME1_9CAUD|nr:MULTISPECIES: tail assembly protein [unclassified Pseudomonas]YP_010773049.1 tail assembly protein [Pseudomonas phage phiAH14a]AMW64492.1 tail assembly protein [Pseudomonas phage phiAH14a]KAA0946681.1 tail assembly protein [Pseudomonas sp. ANT_H4]KAA0953218.1 tail assembly protein [Pseudomonas sp. ANT_H14]
MSALTIEYSPLETIRLGGLLRQFGKEYRLSIRSPAEAIKALCVQIPGFERFLSNAKSRGLEFAVFRGKKNIGEGELGFQGRGVIRVVPVVTGSKRAGLLQTIVGAILIAVSFIPGFQVLMPVGIGLVAGGVIQMLSPQASGLKTSAAPENTPGYAFGSAKNTTASGNPVPLCYGKRRVGGAIISAAIYAEDQM